MSEGQPQTHHLVISISPQGTLSLEEESGKPIIFCSSDNPPRTEEPGVEAARSHRITATSTQAPQEDELKHTFFTEVKIIVFKKQSHR